MALQDVGTQCHVCRFKSDFKENCLQKERNIFLIEDNEIDIMIFNRALQQINIPHKMTIFTNGEEFLSFCKTNSCMPDVLFLDLNTPRMNGLELLSELKPTREKQFFPIVVVSTSAEENDVAKAYQYMANGYITKSISFNTFIENIETVLKYWDTVQTPKVTTASLPFGCKGYDDRSAV